MVLFLKTWCFGTDDRRRCLGYFRNPSPRRYLFMAWDWSCHNRAYHPCRVELGLAPAVYDFYLYFSYRQI